MAKSHATAAFACGLFLLWFGASIYANGIGWILAEEKEISSGSLNGFAIGDDTHVVHMEQRDWDSGAIIIEDAAHAQFLGD